MNIHETIISTHINMSTHKHIHRHMHKYISTNILTRLPIFKATHGLQFLNVYGNISAGAIGFICHQLGLLSTDVHDICCGGLFKVTYQLDQL